MECINHTNHIPREDDEIYSIIRKQYDNRVEDWECRKSMSEKDFYEMFVEENCYSVSCCVSGDKVDYELLKGYMSYTCGVYCGYYEDTPESFASYMS